MAFYYFDASALVKYYVTEPGSTWVRQLIEERDPETGQTRHVILVAEITRVEVAAGLAVIERVGRIRRSERDREYRRFTSQLAHRYAIIPLTTGDLETAAELTQHHPLKAYDAIQLAVALRSRQVLATHQFTFVSSDNTLLTAARAEGLSTDNPFDHVVPEDTAGSSA
jgi:hypothetical protein